ncbi:MAG: alpha/beta hydrolase [Frankiales bacterium]|nr:alpha/beta hydrolase [Frankiales bacterium]
MAVLLHGVQSSKNTWWRIAQDLTELGWDVRALDLLGHGDNRSNQRFISIDDLAANFLDQLDSGGADLVIGHSLGAIVAATAVGRRPGSVRGLIMEDPPSLPPMDELRYLARDIEEAANRARRSPELARSVLQNEHPSWSPIDVANSIASRAMLDGAAVNASFSRMRWDLPALVAGCPVPAFLLAASPALSALHEPDRSRVLAALPDKRSRVIHSGHNIHRDRPALFLVSLLQFAAQLD